jgi:ribonucleoside-triphosphate reductase (thioredoxin)
VMGGVRRSAALCMFDADDEEMMHAKNGAYWEFAPHRANANNSAVWYRRMTRKEVSAFFDVMHEGWNGEPGIFSRYAVKKSIPSRRDSTKMYGTNACGEAILRIGEEGGGLCNLTQVVARPQDTLGTLVEKVEIATMIGTIQSMATNFTYVRKGWRKNAEEERLLGVDITGHYDCEEVRNWGTLIALKSVVVRVNKEYARKLNINQSAATTLVKPSGNSGTLLNVSSGVHPRWSEFYKRNVRVNSDSPIFYVLKQCGFPMIKESDKTYVAGFAVESPEGCVTRDRLDAKDQLEYWELVKTCYAEHSVSMTCYYDEPELDYVKNWVYDNQDIVSGLSFLPRSDAHYENAPYEEISEKEYYELRDMEPTLDFSLLTDIERKDRTEASQEVACSAGQCDMQM